MSGTETVDGATITFLVPLPPSVLRSNSRAYWRTKVAAKVTYSRAVWVWWIDAQGGDWATYYRDLPWKVAKVTYTWRYCGVAPDRQNLGANLKALTDILCCAPDTGLQANHTTYLGLVEDDKGIDPHYALERVMRRAQTGVTVRVERRGG